MSRAHAISSKPNANVLTLATAGLSGDKRLKSLAVARGYQFYRMRVTTSVYNFTCLHVESKMHDVAILDDVILAFEPHLSGLF